MATDLSLLDKKTLTSITNAIRNSFQQNSLEAARCLAKAVVYEGPRQGKRWVCKQCVGRFERKRVNVDHIDPVVPVHLSTCEMSLVDYYKRCFTTETNLQVLCKDCHNIKSDKEMESRKHFRQLRKPLTIITPKKLRVA